MKIDTNNMVSLSEANRNFSQVARMADGSGAVVILRNNAPSYLLTTFEQAEIGKEAPDEDVMNAAWRVAKKAGGRLKPPKTENQHEKTESRRVMRDTDQKIREVNATMAMEGMPLTDEDKNRLRDIFEGRTTVEKTVQALIQKHSQKKRAAYERI
jgi:antitoxin Phd